MRTVYLHEQRDESAFIEKAARYFEEHPKARTFAENDPEPGEFLALRWGPELNCIVLVKLDQYFVPRNYQNVIQASPAVKQGSRTPGDMTHEPAKTGGYRNVDLWKVVLDIQGKDKIVIHGSLIPEAEDGDVPSWYLRPVIAIALTEENGRGMREARAKYLDPGEKIPYITRFPQGKLIITIHSFV